MSWYLRKGLSFGPFRVNLSKSGLGASVGVTGFRIGVGPRGSYVHAGRGGLYYRQPLHPAGGDRGTASPGDVAGESLAEVDSGDVGRMGDPDAIGLLEELNLVQQRLSRLPVVLVAVAAAGVALWGLDARAWAYGAVGAAAILGLWSARLHDRRRCRLRLEYELEGPVARAFDDLARAVGGTLAGCAAVWHVEAEGEIRDRKRQAGASSIVRRRRVAPALGKPRRVEIDLEVPVLPAGRQTLYLFPDRVLVFDGRRVGAVPYPDLGVTHGETRFIEEDAVPADARVVGQTWKYVNKDGGPDRRFGNNPQLPIVVYGEVKLRSRTGLNECFHVSQPSAAIQVVEVLRDMRAALAGQQPGESGAEEEGARARRRRSLFDGQHGGRVQ